MAIATLLAALAFVLAMWANRPLRSQDTLGAHRHWLVLPDEPAPSARTGQSLGQSCLPAVIRVPWSKADEDWNSAKPAEPWFRPSGFGAVTFGAMTIAVGAFSADLSALGLGVPEIFPTHGLAHHHDSLPERPGIDLSGMGLDDLFETRSFQPAGEHAHVTSAASDYAGFETSDFILPASHLALDADHAWWA